MFDVGCDSLFSEELKSVVDYVVLAGANDRSLNGARVGIYTAFGVAVDRHS
jgi:hypothetical protein